MLLQASEGAYPVANTLTSDLGSPDWDTVSVKAPLFQQPDPRKQAPWLSGRCWAGTRSGQCSGVALRAFML